MHRLHPASRRSKQSGITLIETLVSLTLGLAIVSAAFNLYTSNRSVFKQVEGIARMQESARVAAALMAADIRQAGGSLCRNGLPTTNVVTANGEWYSGFENGIQGSASSATDSRAGASGFPRLAGDSFTIWSGNADAATLVASATARSVDMGTSIGQYLLNLNDGTGIGLADFVVLCDFNFALIAQRSLGGNFNLNWRGNDSAEPGNCGAWYKAVASGAVAMPPCATQLYAYAASRPTSISADYTWSTGSMLGKLTVHHWYVGQKSNPSPGSQNNRALRRLATQYLFYPGSTVQYGMSGVPLSEEMVENVSDMQVTYLIGDAAGYPASTSYVAATQVTDWTRVIAVRILLTITSPEAIAVGANGAASAATYTVPINVAIRARLPGRIASQ